MKKNVATLVLAALMALSLTAPAMAAGSGFSDVPSTFWAYTEITEAVSKGITNGYTDGTFKPGNSVTNAHFAAFLARAFYADEYTEGSKSPWYRVYTDVLEEHGILDSTAVSSDFWSNINKPINRYDMAQMMYHILKDKNAKMPTNAEMAAARNAIGDWDDVPAEYRGGVSLCYAMGVLNGQSDGNFGGKNLMNRGQACVVVYRLTQKINGEELPSQPTIPEEVEQPTTPEQPSKPSYSTQTLTNGKAVTEENVSELLEELKVKYPNRGYFDPYNPSYYFEAMGMPGIECAKLAYMLSDEIFGQEAPISSHSDYSNIKLGDIIEHRDENGKTYHWSIVNTVDVAPSGSAYVKVVSGDNKGLIRWNATYYLDKFDTEVIWSRYPK